MTIIITGANRGLGFETALALASNHDHTIILAGRDPQSLDEAVTSIQSKTKNKNLIPLPLDLASLDAVRQFVAAFEEQSLPPLKTILCNAGITKNSIEARSIDGYELTFAINHLGHFLLVLSLLKHLKSPARIIMVSSGAHDSEQVQKPLQPPRYVKADWLAHPEQDPDRPTNAKTAGGQAYASSKLCNVLFAYELSRRLDDHGFSTPNAPITVNAFDPGLMAGTDLGRDNKGLMRFVWYRILPLLSRFMPNGRSPQQSGADLAYLATAEELQGITGRYFSGRTQTLSAKESHDLQKATDLWRTSVCLTQLNEADTIFSLP
ncbi:MAG: SDR family NAD(P)-dependent oxidoreductase [Chloroflexota bacterium]